MQHADRKEIGLVLVGLGKFATEQMMPASIETTPTRVMALPLGPTLYGS